METLKRFVCSKIKLLILTAMFFFGSSGFALSINPTGLAYTPDSVIVIGDTLYLLSRSNLSIFRWSVSQQQYIDTIDLIKFPTYMTYSATLNRLYLSYSDKKITKIDLSVFLTEQDFIILPEAPLGISTAGQYLFVCDSSGAWESHFTYGPDGSLISQEEWNNYSEEFIWSDANQKMYFFRDNTSPNDILWEDIGTDGTIGASQDSPYHGDFRIMHPIRVAPDGSVVLLGSGDIYDAITLEQIDSLANDITDGVWMDGVLYTTRDFGTGYQIQKWGNNYSMESTKQISGTPAGIYGVGNSLVAITVIGGIPEFSVLNSGSFTEPPLYLDSSPSPTYRWLDCEHDGIAYFVFENPARIERYNMETETWLTSISLADIPTAFTVDDNGMYISFSRRTSRFLLDGSGETHLRNTTSAVNNIVTMNNYLYLIFDESVMSVNKITGGVYDLKDYWYSMQGVSIAPTQMKIFSRNTGVSPSDIMEFTLNSDGTLGDQNDSPYHGDYPSATKTFVFPDETLVGDTSGIIYNTSDLTYHNSLAGSFQDMDFDDNQPIVLRDDTLFAYSSSFLETGRCKLTKTPYTIFVMGESIYSFSTSADSRGIEVAVTPISSLEPLQPGAPVNPVGLAYSPDSIEHGNDVIYLLSKSNKSIFRWSIPSKQYIETIPLVQSPLFMTYSSDLNRIYLAYTNGKITKIDLDTSIEEQVFVNLSQTALGLSAAGQFLFACDDSGAWESHYTYGPDGALVSRKDWNYYSKEYIWNETNRKMYFFRDDTIPNDLLWEDIDVNGIIGDKKDSPYHSSAGIENPIRVAPNGSSVVLGSGNVYDGISLELITTLPNTIDDAAWVDGVLFTLQANGGATKIQKWNGYSNVIADTDENGSPLRLFNVDGRLLLITNYYNKPVFSFFDAELNQEANSLQFSTAAYSINEKSASTTITVTRTGGSKGEISVNYATSDGTASAGVDYEAVSGTLTWADGDNSPKTFSVTVLADALEEGSETVNLTLSNPGGGALLGAPNKAVLTIVEPSFEWTLMIYLDGDNNLEDRGIDDFLEMASVGSDANVNIVVQFDRIPGYSSSYEDWTNCQRFHINPGMTPTIGNSIPDWGDGHGGREVNMGDPQSLTDFIQWARNNYPAHKYALVLWDHGDGWKDNGDGEELPVYKAVCVDDSDGGDMLYTTELRSALENIGDKIDLVGFDACLNGMLEVAYEIKERAAIMVASEETEPLDGWPYDKLLADLTANPSMSPTELGDVIVTRYGESYGASGAETQAALDLSKAGEIAAAVSDLAAGMMESDKAEITAVRTECQQYDYPEHIDLYHFAQLLFTGISDVGVQSLASNLMDVIELAVTSEFHGNQSPNSHGLAIYFPASANMFDNDYNGSVIDFPEDTQWDEFLQWYYGGSGYCESSSGDASWEWVSRVQLNTGDLNSGGLPYSDYTGNYLTTLVKGESYTLSVTVNNVATTDWTEQAKAWIDFNQDQDFWDAGEEIDLGAASFTGSHIFSQSVSIPTEALTGVTRMRITNKWGTTPPSACEYYYWGETEDYTVIITDDEKAIITNPQPSTTLGSNAVIFKWNDPGADQYQLLVGTSQGSDDLYSGAQGTDTTALVSGLPSDGSTVYARLLSLVDGAWLYNDYTYTAFDPNVIKAVITSPLPSSTLISTVVTFNWNNSGADQYWLSVGTTAGGHDLYSGDQGSETSHVVSGLPYNGSTVYVRLWSLVNGEWLYNDYTYTAATIVKGDLNGDGAADLTDAIIALQVITGRNPSQLRADYVVSGADVNGDNRVGMEELIYILEHEAALR